MDDKQKKLIRINKFLADRHLFTRRQADEMVKAGHILINGRTAVLGEKVCKSDQVTVQGGMRSKKSYVYLAFNKPKGIVSHSPQKGERGIMDVFKYKQKIFPVGRLDKNSQGLLILTNDGRITDRMLNPDYYHEKEYIVRVDRTISPGFIKNMEHGVAIDEYVTRPSKAKKIDNMTFSIILTEGKKHQIRRMCEKLERAVLDLKRVRVMNVELGNIKPGTARKIEGSELDMFFRLLGIEEGDATLEE